MATTNNTVCTCGARYSAFRSTDGAGNVLTFADVHAMMRVGSDDSSLWVSRSRGAVLRFWSFLKRSQWEAMHGYCEAALAADATADELPEWVTDATSVDVGYHGDDEAPAVEVATVETAIVVEVVEAHPFTFTATATVNQGESPCSHSFSSSLSSRSSRPSCRPIAIRTFGIARGRARGSSGIPACALNTRAPAAFASSRSSAAPATSCGSAPAVAGMASRSTRRVGGRTSTSQDSRSTFARGDRADCRRTASRCDGSV